MNLEIKEKFNNFVKIIENKEKIECLKQINNITEKYKQDKPIIKLNQDNCSCIISSGYESNSSNNLDINKNLKTINKSKSKSKSKTNTNSNTNSKKSLINEKIQEKISNKSKHSSHNKNDELSLLEDDFFIGKTDKHNKNQDIYYQNNKSNELTTKTIGTEFQNIFLINENKNIIKNIKKNESGEIKDRLENIYNKIITKKSNHNDNDNDNNKLSGYKIENYIGSIELINKMTIDMIIKKISVLIEHMYKESIRGWNHEHNLYIMQLDKLKENFEKVVCKNLTSSIKMGFIYRDFNDSKVYVDKDFTKHWIGFNIEFGDKNNLNKMIPTKYSIKNKILFYCLKNLTKSNKFKKKISKWNYKFIKKTIQVYGNKNLFIDIILFIGIKIIE